MATVDRHTELIGQLLQLMTQQHENTQLLLKELTTKNDSSAATGATIGAPNIEAAAVAIDVASIVFKLGITEAKLDMLGFKLDRIIGLLENN